MARIFQESSPFSTMWKPTHPCRISRTYNVLFLCFAERTNGRKRGLYKCRYTHTLRVSPTKQKLFQKCGMWPWCLLQYGVFIQFCDIRVFMQSELLRLYICLFPTFMRDYACFYLYTKTAFQSYHAQSSSNDQVALDCESILHQAIIQSRYTAE